eukprot:CAMPEP_0168863060 /NCGR_PEP_ID=MMETSP0727-20121128/18758_1 /TAXON_ID=265536 /ORGANISM="Amphiprora sp., Strain CCMP467" /LENGTH=119 /DNA_ID=CAMNT_0008918123 /DNA_START=15 /DNA_END=371 /DNA_ORIENTATION=+
MKQSSLSSPGSGVSFQPSAVHYAPPSESWHLRQHTRSVEMDMLASSMMLTTISENEGCGSNNQLNKRWGSVTTRKSYKTDLASLSNEAPSLPQQHHHQYSFSESSTSSSSSSSHDEDCW